MCCRHQHHDISARSRSPAATPVSPAPGPRPPPADDPGTALYDSLVYSLFYSNGLPGQRAILLLSDAVDESSRFSFGETLEYLQRSGVTVYAIGLDLKGEGKRTLRRIAEETGGPSFFLDDVAGLPEVYATIRKELRTKYLLAYQGSNASGDEVFRPVEVRLSRGGLKARTI